ncbi:MAG: dihydropteroate synthase [Actinomycetota bacterium]|nr:dihydropteroate synthase [Actinomycetota bacterium]
MKLQCREHVLSLDRVAIMGVLNVTPDSFSDGGLWLDPDAAVAHALEMVDQGAAIIDIGGESTRPGAEPVADHEELRRVIPVIEAVVDRVAVPISIDTRKEIVAREAVAAGASIVNDTLGEAGTVERVAIETGAALVVMHSRGTPATMRSLTDYGDVVGDVRTWLARRAEALEAAGHPHEAIVLDPGFGFAKTPQQNLILLNRLDEIVELGYPVLVGTSRKSFIGAILDLDESERLEGTAATVTWAIAKGTHIVRVHDVGPISRTVAVSEAIARGSLNEG